MLGLATGLSNFNKSRALTYLASQCLSYVATISKNLSEMLAFYNNEIVKAKEIAIDNKLYGALQKNLYTFLYFLIDSINFRINDDVGLQHYSYWHTFLLKVDFSGNIDYTSSLPSTKYRYSCIECIPSDTLREKMRTTLKKKYVTLENQWIISTIESMSGRAMSSFSSAPRPPEVKYFGFCSEEVLTVCKNYNDNIMRLIELNMYILIKSASENREMIPILKYTDEGVSVNFSNAVFSTKLITKEVEEDFRKEFRKLVNVTAKRESFNKKIMKGQVFSSVYYKIFDNEPDLQVSFDFLIQLNRIISELQHPDFMGNPSNTSNKIISSSNSLVRNGISRAAGVVGYTGYAAASYTTGLIRSPVNFIISDTKLQYEELLREYTLMTGNFLMLTSSFILDKTKLDKDKTERVNNELTETLNKLESSIATLTNDIDDVAKKVEETASKLATDPGVVGEEPQVVPEGDSPANTQGASQGGRSLSKKIYNFSQKRKTKRNKRKRRAF
jgi:hypothetical protein